MSSSSRRTAASRRDPERGTLALEFEEDALGSVPGVVMVRGSGERIPWRREAEDTR